MSLLSSVAINPFEVIVLVDIIERAEKAEADAREARAELQTAWRRIAKLEEEIAGLRKLSIDHPPEHLASE